MQADSQVYVGEIFYITVYALDTQSGQLLKSYNGNVSWGVIGAGSLDILAEDGWSDGKNTYTAKYNGTVNANDSIIIAVSVQDAVQKQVRGVSNNITVFVPVTFTGFKITAPVSTFVFTPFDLTIEAVGSNGKVYEGYTGTADLVALNSSARRRQRCYLLVSNKRKTCGVY